MTGAPSIQSSSVQSGTFHTPFLTLLRKEWRQQRWLVLALPCLGPFAVALCWPFSPDVAVIVAAGFPWLWCPALLGASTFAADVEEGTGRFLMQMPVSETVVFRAKLLFVLTASLLPASVWCALCFVPALSEPVGSVVRSLNHAIPRVGADVPLSGAMVTSLLLTGLWAGIAAGMQTGVLGTAVLCLILGIPAAAWLFGCVVLLNVMLPGVWPVFVLVTWALLLSLAGGRMSFRLRARTSGARLMTATLIVLAYLLATGAPVAGVYARFLLMGPSGHTGAEASAKERWAYACPAGRSAPSHVAVLCSLPWGTGERVAFVDADTGGWQWFSLWRQTRFAPIDYGGWSRDLLWSPDGQKCLLMSTQRVLWPLYAPHPAKALDGGPRWRLGVVEPAHGMSFVEVLDGGQRLWPACGWFDNETVFVCDDTGVTFVKTTTGERHCCRLDAREHRFVRAGFVTDSAVLVWCSDHSAADRHADPTLTLYRCVPGAAGAEEVVLRGVVPLPSQPPVAVSADGRWVAAKADLSPAHPDAGSILVGDLRTGVVRPLDMPAGARQLDAWCVHGSPAFLRSSQLVVLLARGVIGLYDPVTGVWRTVPVREYAERADCRRPGLAPTLSISPDESCVAVLWPSKRLAVGVELDSGRTWPIWTGELHAQCLRWHGNDVLLLDTEQEQWMAQWLVDREGGGVRPLLRE